MTYFSTTIIIIFNKIIFLIVFLLKNLYNSSIAFEKMQKY